MSMPWDKDFTPTSADPELIARIDAQIKGTSTSGPVVSPPAPEVAHPESTGPEPPKPTTPAGGIEDALMEAARTAAADAVKNVAAEIKAALPDPNTVAVHVDPADLLKASARSRALRTFFGGLLVTVLWAVVNVLGTVTGVNWFSKEGWVSVGILAGGAVVNAVVSYVLRVIKPPSLAEIPGGG